MDQFCDTPLWDGNRTWNNTWPELTECFQDTVLLGGPCLLLWLVSALRAFFVINSADDLLPVSGLYQKKMTVSYLLALATLLDLSLRLVNEGMYTEIPPLRADLIAQLVLFATVMLNMSVVRLERRKGVLTSVVLFWFWFALTITQLVPFYTIIITGTYVTNPVESSLFYVKFALILSSLVLHCFAEPPTPEALKSVVRRNFNHGVSVPAKLTERSVGQFMEKGYKSDITSDDMGDLWDSEKSRNVLPRFTVTWRRDVATAKERNRLYELKHPEKSTSRPAFVRSDSVEANKKEQNVFTTDNGHKEFKRNKSAIEGKSKGREFKRKLSVEEKSNDSELRRSPSVEETRNGKEFKRSTSSEEHKKSPKHVKKENAKDGEKKEKPQPKYIPSAFVALLKTYWLDIILTQMLRLFTVAGNLCGPFIFGSARVFRVVCISHEIRHDYMTRTIISGSHVDAR